MEINWIAILLAAVSTLVVGFIWYNPKVFGTIWMKEAGLTEEKMKGANMALIFGLSIIYAIMISLVLQFNVIHQWGALSTVGGNVNNDSFKAFMTEENRNAFRTFKHGVFHGFIVGLMMILPVIGTTSLYERKSFKYVLVTSGFWIVCFMLMGGIICAMK